jgi:ABC-type transport system substrate-binding protein
MLAIGVGLLGTAVTHGREAGAATRKGGTFRIAVSGTLGNIDPPLLTYFQLAPVLDATCARLMNYPDRRPPEGLRLVPEVAARPPAVSNNGKTYRFTLRGGFRFNTGEPVRADAFEQAFKRLLKLNPDGAGVAADIVGADQFRAGQAQSITGIVARGHRLVITLTRSVPDFAVQMAELPFCAVPPRLLIDPEGLTSFPAAGPLLRRTWHRARTPPGTEAKPVLPRATAAPR